MNLQKKFLLNNFQVLAGHILIYVSGIFLTPIIIKTSGEETYGKYVLIISFLGFIYGLSSFGVGSRVHRLLPSESDSVKRAELFFPPFYFQLAITAVIGAFSFIFFTNLSNLFFDGSVGVNAYVFVIYLFLYYLYSKTVDYFRFTHRMGLFTVATTLQPYSHILFSLLIFYKTSSLNVAKLMYSQLLSFALLGGTYFCLLLKEIGIIFKLIPLNRLKAEIAFGLPLVFSYIIDQVLAISDRYVIAGVFSVKSVAYYTVAYSLGSLPIFFAKVSAVVLPPLLSLQADLGDKIQGERMVNMTIKGYLFITIPYIFGSAIVGYPLLQVYANQATAEAAKYVMPVVAVGIVFYGLSVVLMNLLFVSYKTKDLFWGNFFAASLNLGLNLFFIPLFNDIIVAAVTTVLSYILLFFFVWFKIRRDWNIEFDFIYVIKLTLSAICMFAFLFCYLEFRNGAFLDIFSLFLLIVVSAFFYLSFVIILRTFSRSDLEKFRILLKM